MLLTRTTRLLAQRRGFATSSAWAKSKVYPSAAAAVDVVKSNDTLLSGGFGLCGVPTTLIEALSKRKDEVKGITGVSNNAGALVKGSARGLAVLLETGQLSKMISSFIGKWVVLATGGAWLTTR